MEQKLQENPKILVLGNTGMLGRVVFLYLSQIYPESVWGTSREKNNKERTVFFDAQTPSELQNVFNLIGKVTYIINCIGVLRGGSLEEMKTINTDFPQILGDFSGKHGIRIIHVSTDAVFPATANGVNERNKPFPDASYGKSKLLGEIDAEEFLSIRTSLIGFDPKGHKGLLEWILQHANKSIPGFTNQIWSGCTTVQFAMLCEKIISRRAFDSLNRKSRVYHFAPIYPVSKYRLLQDFLHFMKNDKQIRKMKSEKRTRILKTNFEKELWFDEFAHQISDVLRELVLFEATHRTV